MKHLITGSTAVACLLLAGAATADVVCVPEPLVLTQAAPAGTIVFDYTGGGSANVYGYSIEITWDAAVATGVIAAPEEGPFASAPLFFVQVLGPGHVRVDAGLGGEHPGIAAGALCQGQFTAAGGEGATTVVDLAILELRDPLNQDVTGVGADDGLIVVDTGAPVVLSVAIVNDTLPHTDDYLKDTDAVTVTASVVDGDPGFGAANVAADLTGLGGGAADAPASYAGGLATWILPAATCTPADGEVTVTVTATDPAGNAATGSDTIVADNTPPAPLADLVAAPGHEKVHLSWADASDGDLHPYGIELRWTAWGDHPEYDGDAPAYPATHLDGALAVQAAAAAVAADWAQAPRDIYYLAGFAYDIVLNYGATGPTATARATNYWLGDVEPAAGDGDVDVLDVDRLGDTYGLLDGDAGFDAACNVGPTDTGHPRAIPLPNADNEVGFEDLMIFALNFGEVSPLLRPTPAEPPLFAWRQVAPTIWALELVRPCGALKGVNLAATLPAGVTCEVTAGDLLAAQSAPVFLRNVAGRGLDVGLALLGQGAGIAGSGELIRVAFSEPLGIAPTVTARGLANEDLLAEISGATDAPVPGVASLEANHPNPFNPCTTMVFSLPAAAHARLAVYGVDGALVRILIDEPRPAGRHVVAWDGVDEAGRAVASGTYLYVMQAGDFRQVRKMSLMR